jgi:hypothetical protein
MSASGPNFGIIAIMTAAGESGNEAKHLPH